MHQTKTPSPNTKRNQRRLHNKVLLVGKPPIAQYQPAQQTARVTTKASRLLDIPRFSPYHPACRQHTSQFQPLGVNDSDSRGRAAAYSNFLGWRARTAPGLTWGRVPVASLAASKSVSGGNESGLSVFLPAEVWWGRGRKVSALLGFEPSVTRFLPAPPMWAGGGGIDTPPGRSYSCEACDSWCCSFRWRRDARTPPMPVMPVAKASRMPSPPALGSTPKGVYV